MKKILPPFILALCVFAVSILAQRCTLLCQECDGLFLMTPDYFRWAFEKPFPISQIVSDFLVQFYRISLCAPWIVALIVTSVFLLVRGILRVTRMNSVSFPLLVAAAVWFVMAVTGAAKPGVAVVLCLLPVWLISFFFRKREGAIPAKADTIASVVIVLTTALLLIFNPGIKKAETWARVKNAAIYGKWAVVNEAVSAEMALADHELTPFALLALDARHKLGDAMFSYPVYEENDLDMCLESDYYNSIFFHYILHSHIGCRNEAIHNLAQLATVQPHGTSFMVLRKLVSENFLAGNFDMVEKYCKVLERSQTHRGFISSYRTAMSAASPRNADGVAFRSTVPVINHNPAYNLVLFGAGGIPLEIIRDRLLCTLLLKRDLSGFLMALNAGAESPSTLPRHYQEALAIAEPRSLNMLASDIRERFRIFMDAYKTGVGIPEQNARFGDTYWFYYYHLK